MNPLSHLEPAEVLQYFYDFTTIPHPSGEESALADYLAAFAAAHGLACHRDGMNNVLIRKKASPGMEQHPGIVLQGHLDMVCEKNAGIEHDFSKDPLKLRVTGDFLSAEGTTLGGDDGVAGAIMLAILADNSLPHPPLECLFTTEEEVGLNGMREFDATLLEGRMLLNIDSVGEGEATVSCAGGCRTDLRLNARRAPDAAPALRLHVGGLAGGHSGENIHQGRCNAIKLAVRLLEAAAGVTAVRIAALHGGCKDNAIPRECTVCFSAENAQAAAQAIRAEMDTAQGELISLDAGVTCLLEPAESSDSFPAEASARLRRLLRILPSGVLEMCHQGPSMPETSANLGIAETDGQGACLTISSRSSVDSRLTDLLHLLEDAGALAGAAVTHHSRYPGWAFREGTRLQAVYLETYRRLTGREARLIGIHAGLECGLMAEKLPEMDMISIGPDLRDIHSPDERLSISSLGRTYELVRQILQNL